MDTARIAGSLLGAALLSTIGIGAAYGAVVGFYLASVILASGISVSRRLEPAPTNPWQELKSGFTYIRSNNAMVAIMCLAFVINLTAFPIPLGLLPVVARHVYELDENGLARLVASYAFGALIGSMMIASLAGGNRPGMITVLFTLAWYLLIILFAHTTSAVVGTIIIVFIGAAQSFSMISMSVLLLSTTDQSYRGRVFGVRMLAVYGLPLGLVTGGALIEWVGITTSFTVFGAAGFACTLAIAMKWPVLIRS
jgi:predicted MFS family arabinose efflux permease